MLGLAHFIRPFELKRDAAVSHGLVTAPTYEAMLQTSLATTSE